MSIGMIAIKVKSLDVIPGRVALIEYRQLDVRTTPTGHLLTRVVVLLVEVLEVEELVVVLLPPCDQIPVPLMKGQTTNQSNFMNPCGGTGWTPVPTVPLEQPPTMFDLIATTINLHSSEISWLLNNQVSAVEISNFLSNSKSTVNPITNLPYYPLANPKAIVAARSFK